MKVAPIYYEAGLPSTRCKCGRVAANQKSGPSVKKLLAYEKEVNEGFAKTAALGGRVHPQIAWVKLLTLRGGAAIASKKLWS